MNDYMTFRARVRIAMDVMLGRFIKVKPSVYQLKSEAAVIDFDSGFPH